MRDGGQLVAKRKPLSLDSSRQKETTKKCEVEVVLIKLQVLTISKGAEQVLRDDRAMG